jgi:hypothetical protein
MAVVIGLSHILSFADDRANLREEMSKTVMVTKDMVHRSPHGYSILVPKGYSVRPCNRAAYGGLLSLLLVKDHGNDLRSVITVLVKSSRETDPRKAVEAVCEEVKKQNKTLVFSRTIFDKKRNTARKNYRGPVKGYALNGIVVTLSKNNRIYELGLQSYAYQKAKSDFERIIKSFQ